jgi:hypothetical protein
MLSPRWERLAALGVRSVTLVPDPAAAFGPAVLGAVDSALRARPAPAVYVVLPEAWEGHSSAADYLRARGRPALVQALGEGRVPACTYRALAILRKHCPATGWNESARHAAWKEAIEYYATSEPGRRGELDADFVPTIVAGLARSWDTFTPTHQSDISAAIDVAPLPEAAPSPPAPAAEPVLPEPEILPPPVPALSQQPEPVETPRGPRPTRNGLNGYCRHHQCSTWVCYCFD